MKDTAPGIKAAAVAYALAECGRPGTAGWFTGIEAVSRQLGFHPDDMTRWAAEAVVTARQAWEISTGSVTIPPGGSWRHFDSGMRIPGFQTGSTGLLVTGADGQTVAVRMLARVKRMVGADLHFRQLVPAAVRDPESGPSVSATNAGWPRVGGMNHRGNHHEP